MVKINYNINSEIKGCPFCGSDPELYFGGQATGDITAIIKCKHGCAAVYEKTKLDSSLKEVLECCQKVIERWNTRAKIM